MFTLSEYESLLVETIGRYRCVGFDVLKEDQFPTDVAIIRHDVDMSPQRALALAQIEAKHGVVGNYTVLFCGSFYNPFAPETRRIFQSIRDLGHNVGLHFDASWHGISSESDLTAALTIEAATLSRLLSRSEAISFFSFHNTTPFSMGCKQDSYANLFNAYAARLQSDFQYTSDSNGYWIHRSWRELLAAQHSRIQVLTHPEWWDEESMQPAERVASAIEKSSFDTWTAYRRDLVSWGRENRTGLSAPTEPMLKLLGANGERVLFWWLSGNRELACFHLNQALIRQGVRIEDDGRWTLDETDGDMSKTIEVWFHLLLEAAADLDSRLAR